MPYVPAAVLERLLLAAEADDQFTRCEHCGAWMFSGEPGASTVADDWNGRIDGCWWSVTFRDKDKPTCFGRKRGGDVEKVAP